MNQFYEVKKLFQGCSSNEDRHHVLIHLGRHLPSYPEDLKTEAHLVRGCQSTVYLSAKLVEGQLFFSAFSDALISSGLAALLLHAYNGRSPEFILKNKPTFLEELSILSSLTPGRSNGLASMYARMQQVAIKILTLEKV